MKKNQFTTTTPAPKWKLEGFDLSHEKKFSFKMGQLIPIYWDDIIPGDVFNVRSEVFVRFAPLLAPVLHRYNVFTHYFEVPYRLLMNALSNTNAGWEDFITGDPQSRFTNEILPYITISNANKAYFYKGELPDYFGLPILDGTTPTQDIDINCLPFLAYQLIFDNYYADQNLMAPLMGVRGSVDLEGGDKNSQIDIITQIRYRSYEKDYFTAGLPTAYAGSSDDVELGLDVYGLGAAGTYAASFVKAGEAQPGAGDSLFSGASTRLKDAASADLYPTAIQQGYESILEIYELRRAEALVRSLEAEQRGGKRYVEMLLGKFGVISDDYRSAIPKYLGGGKQNVIVSNISNMSQTLDPTAGVNDGVGGAVVTVDPQAGYAGEAISVGKNNRFSHKFTEHGIVLGIMSVIPRTAYGSQGIERYWRKVTDRYDFFDPYLQGIGDQAVLQSEVYYDPVGVDADDEFHYQTRWSEYKFKNSSVHGDFRDDFNYWHSAVMFSSAPSFNYSFIQATPTRDELNRIFAVSTAEVDKMYCQVFNNVKAFRPMRVHDIPR